MQTPQLLMGALALCLLAPSHSESNPSDAAVENPVHRVPLSALQTSESVSYHVPAAPPGSNQGRPSSHHTLYQPESATASPQHRRFPAIAMLFPTTLTPYASPPSSSSILHHHLRESSGVSTKYQSAEQYEPPRRPSASQFGAELPPRPGRREPQQPQHHHHQQHQPQHQQHSYGGSVLPKLSSPYSSYAQGLSMDQAEKRPQDVSAYEAPPVVPDAPPRFLYERPLVEHERSHGRPMTSLVESSHYEQQQLRERPSQQQQQQSSLFGSPKYATAAQLRSQYAPQVVTEKPLAAPPMSSYVNRPVVKYGSLSSQTSSGSQQSSSASGGADDTYGLQTTYHRASRPELQQQQQEQQQQQPQRPESRIPVQDEQPQQQSQPSRKLHPSPPETSPIYSR
ncbi:unnamed protein product [Ixodes hexagonus]